MNSETLGQHLKREREFRKLSLEELSQKTRINPRLLKALEADQYEALPGTMFVKGFIKAYAQVLGLSTEDLSQRYEQLIRQGALALPNRSFQKFAIKPRQSKWLYIVTLFSLLLLIAIYFSAR